MTKRGTFVLPTLPLMAAIYYNEPFTYSTTRESGERIPLPPPLSSPRGPYRLVLRPLYCFPTLGSSARVYSIHTIRPIPKPPPPTALMVVNTHRFSCHVCM